MKLYTIKDIKALNFHPALTGYANKFVAERDLISLVNDRENKTNYSRFPEDYELWQVGEFDETTGVLTPCLEFVINLAELKQE